MENDKKAGQVLKFLEQGLGGYGKTVIMDLEEYLELVREDPQKTLRNIFQLFHDMVQDYIGEGEDEYPDDPESIGFVKYDCSKIFQRSGSPYFADRLFANRFARQVGSLRQGSQQNRINVYEGPHGCGKSTFLNNLLKAFEEYSDTPEGKSYEIFWEVSLGKDKNIKIPCPSHDHPILIIPKNLREDFLDKLVQKEEDEFKSKEEFSRYKEFKYKLSSDKAYEWVFEREVCTICKSLFWNLLNHDSIDSLDEVFKMVKVRPYKFDRRLGEGVSVFNPGDRPIKESALGDKQIQEKLDKMFGANLVKYIYSQHARTNNGIYVLMDIKSHNEERILALHNVISEGVLKVNGLVEEKISSLFLALMNPEDKENIESKSESFQGRIKYSTISYVLDVPTEIKIYRSIFGEQIDTYFLPGVLENFARVIISSRMNSESKLLKDWIPDIKKYEHYCDSSGLLLRMEIYAGIIPPWLSEEDKRMLTSQVRRQIVTEGEKEGRTGFHGRESIGLFKDIIDIYGGRPRLISMSNVEKFFKKNIGREKRNKYIPSGFIDSLVNWYDYRVLQEVKESLYFYNEDKITENLLNYLCAVNYEIGDRIKCQFTGQEIGVTSEFLVTVGVNLVGKDLDEDDALIVANEVQKSYIEEISQNPNRDIKETELYKELFSSYVRNLKKRALDPFLERDNFSKAVESFGSQEFNSFDTRLKEHISHMIRVLVKRFGYTEQGAKEICLYVTENGLVQKFT